MLSSHAWQFTKGLLSNAVQSDSNDRGNLLRYMLCFECNRLFRFHLKVLVKPRQGGSQAEVFENSRMELMRQTPEFVRDRTQDTLEAVQFRARLRQVGAESLSQPGDVHLDESEA